MMDESAAMSMPISATTPATRPNGWNDGAIFISIDTLPLYEAEMLAINDPRMIQSLQRHEQIIRLKQVFDGLVHNLR
jgi:hypothetical protein